MSAVIRALAHREAVKAVKHQLRAQGEKVSHYSAKEITALAEAYLAEHQAELFEEVRQLIAGSARLQELCQKAECRRLRLQRQLQRQLQKAIQYQNRLV